ncbi:hypothetical protein HOE37_00265 [Candidatus Woesearchaeota archaeon]|jgi:hypothetical protein|nr:hypothetical protein [Candidatus Woesearchaeota archaeon]MBT4336206.1 hypothetical protein [Candidatus Woesearchaeota archaeon]MBT4468815.1 hypothetical protein [Candidatus Woesearchaeota archaeon]MBT6744866.1 hypothetical protein [Candidatus Woesearchaeota archaeon]
MTNEMILPSELIETGGKRYWKTEGRLYLPEDIDEEAKVAEAPLTAEERIIQEVAGEGKVISDKRGIALVREPTILEKITAEAKEALQRLATPRNLAYAAGVACAILAPGVGLADETPASGSVELSAGHQSTTLDTKVSTSIAPKTNLFLRQMTTSDYEGEVSFFGLMDLSYNLVDGLDIVGEVQAAPGMGVIPRAGLQYFKALGDFAVYALATVKTMESPDGEFVVNLSYSPELGEKVDLLINLEDLTSVGETGHQFSVQKLRAGVTLMDKYQIGAAADLTEVGNEGTLDYNLGGFVGTTF